MFITRLTSLFHVRNLRTVQGSPSLGRETEVTLSDEEYIDGRLVRCIYRAENVPGRAGARLGMRVAFARRNAVESATGRAPLRSPDLRNAISMSIFVIYCARASHDAAPSGRCWMRNSRSTL